MPRKDVSVFCMEDLRASNTGAGKKCHRVQKESSPAGVPERAGRNFVADGNRKLGCRCSSAQR
jgi:hypothetical protein